MKINVLNGVTKLVNSMLWAVLVKLLIVVGFEVWLLYQETLPETVRSLEIWGNSVVVLVFLIAVTTYRFQGQLEVKMPPERQRPPPEEPQATQFDEILKTEEEEPKLDDDLEKIKLGLQ